mgnify:FL=1
MTDDIILRRGMPADHVALGEVMYAAVRNGPSRYTPAQQVAWVPEPRRGTEWDARLSGQRIVVAEAGGEVIGFMTLAPPDYVDFAYIRPDWQGRGLFRRLYDAVEAIARENGQVRLTVHASLMARPAFAAVGFAVTAPEEVELRGEIFKRFAMEKQLAPQ